ATETARPLQIVDLEPEIIAEILEYVNDESPGTIPALSVVSNYFYHAVKLVKYRRATVNWSDKHVSWIVSDRKYILQRPNQASTFNLDQAGVHCKDSEFLQRVRHLTIGPSETRSKKNQSVADDELVEILTKASNIKALTWKPTFSPSAGAVEALEKYHPKAELRISRITIPQSSYNCDPERIPLAASALLKSTSLRSLGIRRYRSGDDITSFDYRLIISNAENLEFVSVISDGPETADEDNSRTEGRKKLRHLTLDGWQLSQDTVDYWSQYINLTELQSFKCSRGSLSTSYFVTAADLLPGLKHVSLNLGSQKCSTETTEAVQRYISSCSPLKTLSLWSWIGRVSLQSILQQHGSTLEVLRLHEREEIGDDPDGQKFISLADVHSIRASCPRLKSFTFDLKRQSKQPRANDYQPILAELVKMQLDTLEIYLDSGLLFMYTLNRWNDSNLKHVRGGNFGRGDTNDPGRNKVHPPTSADDICTFTGEMWKSIFGSRISGPRMLDLKFGEWERNSLPLLTDPYGEPYADIRVWTRAKPHQRDDKPGECSVEMKGCGGKHRRKWTTD
ncbi:uncharacterized protein A1O9_02433, partial [Exophiala aquamarina CBS 119918]